ncbi:gap junction alpha-4 protein [Salmo salar]|uniref:Gap junction protein n=1 Tax=Salmo salar TaxID=8030 RepID=A0A1S3Q2V7_SALSA|nr:gap junction alpha-4 protein [Salmo salar]|eukprot:XP_014034282.1 PREDICTED: gap junction alpha-4 protein-like [Salmo salar]
MSRADWSFLEHLLEEGQEYSTGVGRVWLTVLFLFRMLVLGTAAESAWDDEQVDFVCNTNQPGCTAVCYDKAFPISHYRYFVLQVIFVSTPTIFYFGYVAFRAAKEKKEEEGEENKRSEEEGGGGGERRERGGVKKNGEKKREVRKGDEIEELEEEKRGRKEVTALPEVPKLKGRLLCAYAASILLKVLLEVGFIVGLWCLYGFVIPARFECVRDPCPHTVDCFVSRPTEKTIFTIYTQAIAGVSLLLNLAELLHLLQLAVTHHLEKRYAQEQYTFPGIAGVRFQPGASGLEMEMQQASPYQEKGHLHLPMREASYAKPSESYLDLVSGAGMDHDGDLLPSYLNYMGAMRTTHSSGRATRHTTHTHSNKHSKGAQKGHSNKHTTHYV